MAILRNVLGRLDVTVASVGAQVAEMVRSAPSAPLLVKAQARESELRSALRAKELERERLVSSIGSVLVAEALQERALALVETGATGESQAQRVERERESLSACNAEIKVLRAAVEIAKRKVGDAHGLVSAEVNARTLELDRAVVARIDAALQALSDAVRLEAALVSGYQDNDVARHRFQPSGFRPQTYLDDFSTATTWRREVVRAGLLDAEPANANQAVA